MAARGTCDCREEPCEGRGIRTSVGVGQSSAWQYVAERIEHISQLKGRSGREMVE
jgi:hypothetical protein